MEARKNCFKISPPSGALVGDRRDVHPLCGRGLASSIERRQDSHDLLAPFPDEILLPYASSFASTNDEEPQAITGS
jgi:hypothetical protein